MSIFKRNNIQNHTADTYTSEVHGSANSTNEFEQLALYSKNLRGLAGQIMPKAEKTAESQRLLLRTLCEAIEPVSFIESNADDAYWKHFETESETHKIVARIAHDTNIFLSTVPCDYIDSFFESVDTKKLVAAWGVIDFYIFLLKPEYSLNLRSLRNRITEFLYHSELKIEREDLTPIEILQRDYHSLYNDKTKSTPEALAELRTRIGKLLTSLDSLWIAYDANYRFEYPYVSIDGYIEIFTKEEYAVNAQAHALNSGISLDIKRADGSEVKTFFEDMHSLGLSKMRLNSGSFGVMMNIDDFYVSDDFVVDYLNRNLRGDAICKLQLQNRLNKRKIAETRFKKASLCKKAVSDLTKSICESLRTSVIYVLIEGTYINGVTLYSRNAYEKVSETVKKSAKDEAEAMTAQGDYVSGVADSIRKLGVVNIGGKGAYACAFTKKSYAEKVRKQFASGGNENNIVAVNFDEIADLIKQCDGLAIDISEYGYLIPKSEFDFPAIKN